MKLSEAMEKGIVGMKQIKNDLFQYQDGKIIGCCPLGAACIASEVHSYEAIEAIEEKYPILLKRVPNYLSHVQLRGEKQLESNIWLLNDVVGLLFQEIIDWVKSVEDKI